MKKLVNYIAIAATAALIPFTASALEPMSETAKKELTGQAGVTIGVEDVRVETWTGETKYIDSESGTGGDGGAIVVSGQQVSKRIRGLGGGDYNTDLAADLLADYSLVLQGLESGGAFFKSRSLSIDVGECEVLTNGLANNRAIYVANGAAADAQAAAVAYLTDPTAPDALETYYAAVMDNDLLQFNAAEAQGLLRNVQAGGTLSKVIGVQIELPTVVVETTGSTMTAGVAELDANANTGTNSGCNFITVEKSASVMAVYQGRIEIAAH